MLWLSEGRLFVVFSQQKTMEAPEDAAMLENCTDPVQLKPFELLDDIMNTVRLDDYFSLSHLIMLLSRIH